MLKRIISNKYIFSLITKTTLVFIGLLNSIFINRFLGPSLKGEYAFILNIVNILVLILNLGIYQSYPFFKRNDKNRDIKNKYFNIIFLQFLIYFLCAMIISLLFMNLRYAIIIMIIPLMILSNQILFIVMIEDINLKNKINIGNQIFYTLLLLFVFKWAPQDYLYIILLLYIKDILIIFRMKYKFKLKFDIKIVDLYLVKTSIKFGFFPMITLLLISMNYSFDIIILKLFVDYEQIGLYTIGVGLAKMVWIIPDAFKEVLFTKVVLKNSVEDVLISIKINLYISIFTILSIIIIGKQVIILLYGQEFIQSYGVTVVIFIGIIPMLFYKLIYPLFLATGKQKVSFYILLISVVLNIILNFIFIPSYGNLGAAMSSVVSYSACGFLFTYIFAKEFKLKSYNFLFMSKLETMRIKELLYRKTYGNS